ncbi:hypothetical protein [Candidatus Palauibacter sp.]|uniref:hypothetical protein n=1 Tax=Candidatus Palauibacter sp. TaxID=3101350 RepID=UPI003B52ADAF
MSSAYETLEELASVLGLNIQEVLQRAVGSGNADGAEGVAPLASQLRSQGLSYQERP